MGTVAAVAPSEPARVRPDVLGYPSPTTSRYLIFAAALLASGLFVGNFVHNWALGPTWQQTVAVCEGRYGSAGPFDEPLPRQRQLAACTADVERTRVAVTVSGALFIGLAAVTMMWVAPVVVGRRRRLRPLPPALAGAAQRFADLAREAGVADRVAPVLGPASQRDAFSYGAPGRYRVCLPPGVAVRWRDSAVFDPLVSHELSHVVHRDVALAWLTRLVWFALAPLLALPVAVGLATGDRSILGAYTWRIALLWLVVALLSNALLRSREYGADLRAARLRGSAAPVVALVRRARSPRLPRLGGLLAKHPSTDQRVAVLEDPAVLTRTGFVDGLTGAFLAALAVPLVVSGVSPLFSPSGRSDLAYLVAAALLGPMLAGSVGLGLSRAALVARVRGRSAPVGGVALGVASGLMLGQAASLQQAGTGSATGLTQPVWLLASGLAGAGAVLLAGGLGHLWADAAPRLPGVRLAWILALAVNTLVFSTVLWASTLFQTAVDLGGWALGSGALLTVLAPWGMFWVALLLTAAAVLALLLRVRERSLAPPWLVEGTDSAPWPRDGSFTLREPVVTGLTAGAAGALAVVAFRLAVGPASPGASYERFLGYQWLAALVAGTTVLVLMTMRPHRGGGAALVSSPVAVVVVLFGFMVLNTGLGGQVDLDLMKAFLRPGVVLGLYATLTAAPVAALVLLAAGGGGTPQAARLPLPVVLALTLALSGAVSTAALGARTVLVGDDVAAMAGQGLERSDADGSTALATEFTTYLAEVVPAISQRYGAAESRGRQIWADPTLDVATKSSLTRREVLPTLTGLLSDMERYPTGSSEVAQLHQEALAALRTAVERYGVRAGLQGAGPAADDGLVRALEAEEAGHWRAWLDRRQALALELLDR